MSQTGISSKNKYVSSSATAGKILDMVDDFVTGIASTADGVASVYGWINDSSGANSGPSASDIIDANHPGIISISSGTSATGVGGISLHDNVRGSIVLGSGVIKLVFFAKLRVLSDGTNSYRALLGFGDSVNTSPPNGLWFEYTHSVNSGNWQIKSSSASTVTTANTTTAADTDWHSFEIQVNEDATSISFLVDGVEVDNSPITTNIPVTGIAPQVDLENTGGTGGDRKLDLDLFTMSYVLTNSRI